MPLIVLYQLFMIFTYTITRMLPALRSEDFLSGFGATCLGQPPGVDMLKV
jgi:hypothetical protein